MTPAVPPLPTSWNLPFQPCVGSHTSNCTAGLVTPTTRQIGSATVPTGFGLAPAGSSCARLIAVSGSASAASAAQLCGLAAEAAPAPSARAIAATASVACDFMCLSSINANGEAPLRRLSNCVSLDDARVVHDFAVDHSEHGPRAPHVGITHAEVVAIQHHEVAELAVLDGPHVVFAVEIPRSAARVAVERLLTANLLPGVDLLREPGNVQPGRRVVHREPGVMRGDVHAVLVQPVRDAARHDLREERSHRQAIGARDAAQPTEAGHRHGAVQR